MAYFLTPLVHSAANVVLRRPDRTVHCRFSSVSASAYPAIAERRFSILSDAELAYFDSLPVVRRQTSYLLGRFAAKNALASLIGEDDYRTISIEPGIFGQPIVRYRRSLGYNISISHNRSQAVAVAFDTGHPMGIDIEEFDPTLYETLLSAVPEEELRFLDRSKKPSPELLLILWTMKEALSKVLRCGMTTPASVLAVASLDRLGNYTYQSAFRNFGQYKALSWASEALVMSIVLPLRTEIEFDPFHPKSLLATPLGKGTT